MQLSTTVYKNSSQKINCMFLSCTRFMSDSSNLSLITRFERVKSRNIAVHFAFWERISYFWNYNKRLASNESVIIVAWSKKRRKHTQEIVYRSLNLRSFNSPVIILCENRYREIFSNESYRYINAHKKLLLSR